MRACRSSRAVPVVRTLLLHSLLVAGHASIASAQSAQKVSLQLAVLSTSIGGTGSSSTTGVGIEPQLRFNQLLSGERYVVSLGVGGQYTTHASGGDKLNIAGAFLEPRYVPVIGSGRVVPYLSGRLALLQQSSNFGSSSSGYAYGAGGGIVVSLSRRVNLDAGAQLVRQKFGDFEFTDGSPGSFNPFTTYAAKIGFNLGLGR